MSKAKAKMPSGWRLVYGEKFVALYHHHLAVMSCDLGEVQPGFYLQGQSGHKVPHRVFQTFLGECQRVEKEAKA